MTTCRHTHTHTETLDDSDLKGKGSGKPVEENKERGIESEGMVDIKEARASFFFLIIIFIYFLYMSTL